MACIRALVMIEYQVINHLIFSNKTYVVDTQKNRHNETALLQQIQGETHTNHYESFFQIS